MKAKLRKPVLVLTLLMTAVLVFTLVPAGPAMADTGTGTPTTTSTSVTTDQGAGSTSTSPETTTTTVDTTSAPTDTTTTTLVDTTPSPTQTTTTTLVDAPPDTTTTAANAAPVVNTGDGATIDAGDTFTSSCSFTDADSTSWTATVDYGDGVGAAAVALNADQTFNLNHVYTTAGSYTVTVTVTDDQGAAGSATVTVVVNAPAPTDTTTTTVDNTPAPPDTTTTTTTVDSAPTETTTTTEAPNVAPVVNTGDGATINAGDTFTSTGSFTDADSTSWTAAVDYGDGSGAAALNLNADQTFNLSHVYTTPGSYTVTLTVTDNQGAAGSATATVVVNAVPKVWTDKSDYSPGATVDVTATGFWPNEPMHFSAIGSPNGLQCAGDGVTDANGSCSAVMQLPNSWDQTYVLTATGDNSGLTAQTTFTDATKTASVSGNWSNTATWGGAAVPVVGDAVVINSGITVTLDVNTAAVASVSITAMAASGTNGLAVGTYTLNTGSIAIGGSGTTGRNSIMSVSTGTINCTGAITYTGTAAQAQLTFTGAGILNIGGNFTPGAFTCSTGTVNCNGTSAQALGGAFTYYNVTTSGSNTVTIGGTTTISGNLLIGNGTTFTVGAYTLTVTGTTTVGGGASGTLTFSSATNPAKTFTGLVTINSGASWTESAAITPTFSNGITNNGTFTASTGVHTFSTNSQALTGTFSIPKVTVTGITLTNNGTLTVGTALAGTGGLTNAATGTLNVGGTSGTCSITTFSNAGTVGVTGTGAITTALANFTNTGTLNLGGSGAITGITNNAGGIVNLASSGIITSFNNATSTSTLNISDNTVPTITTLTATASGNTVNYNGAAQTVKATSYSNLALSGSGIKSIASGTAINGNLSISGSAQASIGAGLNIAVNTLTLGGTNKASGTWGSTAAGKTHQNDTYFASTAGYLTVTVGPQPAFSGLTASQSIIYGTASVTLSGTVSASGPVYPANGEIVNVTINGSTQPTTIAGTTGGFSFNFPTATIPVSGTPYTITYTYAGDDNLNAASDTSTALTVNMATVVVQAPSDISLGSMSIGSNGGTSATPGSVTTNDPNGCKVTVASNSTAGKMTNGIYTLDAALSVTTGSLSGVAVTTTPQTCVSTSAPGVTDISLSVSQTIFPTDIGANGYTLILTYTATLN